MHPEYAKLAYEEAVLMALVRVCKDEFMPNDISEVPKRKLISERLPLEESTVPEDAVYGVAQLLLRMAQRRQAEMARYRYIRAVDEEEDELYEPEAETFAESVIKEATAAVPRKASRKRRRRGGGSAAQAANGPSTQGS